MLPSTSSLKEATVTMPSATGLPFLPVSDFENLLDSPSNFDSTICRAAL